MGYNTKSRKSGGMTSVLSGSAKLAKMKEAEEYRDKAKKAMGRGLFSRPDPIAAGNFYKRAADAYKQCGENRLERLHRIASGDCQMGQDAYATAASEYTRAAELAEMSDETLDRKRAEVAKLHGDAANAWRQQGELGRAGDSSMKAAFGWLLTDEDEEVVQQQSFASDRKRTLMNMDRRALKAIEEAVELHVPDVLNRYGRYRETGVSAYVDPNSTDAGGTPSEDTMALARHNMVTTSYAHEPMFRATFKLLEYGEYPSALYAVGAASAILESDDFATISVSRAYCTETIITLAMGDVVAAEKYFMQVHLQRNSYLTSRECKLAEDLIRAVKEMDGEALEEARSPGGSNRAALSNLDGCLRGLVMDLRMSGTAKKKRAPPPPKQAAAPPPAAAPSAPPPEMGVKPPPLPPVATAIPPTAAAAAATGGAPAATTTSGDAVAVGELAGDELQAELDANFAEMDDLMDDMGLNSDEEEEEEEEEDDDDDIDLR